jgi:hydroxypyruvate isomerase
MIRELGLQISLVSSHGFAEGPFNRANHPKVIQSLREGIDVAVQFGSSKVITFTGMREPGISDEDGAKELHRCMEAGHRLRGREEGHALLGAPQQSRRFAPE